MEPIEGLPKTRGTEVQHVLENCKFTEGWDDTEQLQLTKLMFEVEFIVSSPKGIPFEERKGQLQRRLLDWLYAPVCEELHRIAYIMLNGDIEDILEYFPERGSNGR